MIFGVESNLGGELGAGAPPTVHYTMAGITKAAARGFDIMLVSRHEAHSARQIHGHAIRMSKQSDWSACVTRE